MVQCSCLKSNGVQCTRDASLKSGDNLQFCWQHQKCIIGPHVAPIPINQPIVVHQPTNQPIVAHQPTNQPIVAHQPPMPQPAQGSPIHESRKLKELSGPSKFYYFNNVIGKRVLLLGEAHDNKGLCNPTPQTYEVHQWLSDLAVNAPDCLDIFVEKSYQMDKNMIPIIKKLKPLAQYDSPGQGIKNVFNVCQTANIKAKKNCLSSQLRYHYIDVRGFKGSVKSPFLEWYLKLGAKEFYKAGKIAQQFFDSNYQLKVTIYKYILGLDRTSGARIVFETYLDTMSQILEQPWDKQALTSYMELYYNLIDNETKKMSSVVSKSKFFKVLLQIYLDSQSDIDSTAFIIPQDVYFLLRLFMRFDKAKLNRGPAGCQAETNYKVQNAIVYGGGHHIKIYERFIRRYFGIQPNISIANNYDNKCIQFSNPFDFFQAISEPIQVGKNS
jgi:hypothetical protein